MSVHTPLSVAIDTRLGMIEGLRDAGVLAFRGIRYAEPPVGGRRFLPPVAAAPWTGTRDATRFADRCMQKEAADILGEPVGGTSEDCLFLNLVTPSVAGRRRPVLFWIHGGGFVSGSGNEYDGSMLAAQGDVVVVTINYRLGHFGFLDLSSLGQEFAGSASNGIRDQILALEWVRDNVADYGGDPGNVTIFGESAGGHSVHILLAAPAADGLYHRAIAHSPGAASLPPVDDTGALAEHLGVASEGLADALRALSAEELLAVQEAVPSLAGVVDGTVVTRSTHQAIVARGDRGVPLIAGSNRDEGTLFTAMLGPGTETPHAAIARLLTVGADPSAYIDALVARYPHADAMEIYERILGHVFLRAAIGSTERATAAGPGGWLYRFDLRVTERWRGPGTRRDARRRDSLHLQPLQRAECRTVGFARPGRPGGAGSRATVVGHRDRFRQNR